MGLDVRRRRRRPCRNCGGVYFARGIAPLAAVFLLVGFAAGAYGIYSVVSYSMASAQGGGAHGSPVFLTGFVVMLLAALIGRRWRCINCDIVQ